MQQDLASMATHNTMLNIPKGPKYVHGTKHGFCSNNFPYGLGKYSPYVYLGPFGYVNLEWFQSSSNAPKPWLHQRFPTIHYFKNGHAQTRHRTKKRVVKHMT